MASLKEQNNQKLILSASDRFLEKFKNQEITFDQYYDAISIMALEYKANEDTINLIQNNTIKSLNGIVDEELIKTDFSKLISNDVKISEEKVEPKKSLSINKEKIDKIKKHLKYGVATAVVIGGVIFAISSCNKKDNSKKKPLSKTSATIINETPNLDYNEILSNATNTTTNNNVIINNENPLLSFNAEDKNILNENIYNLFKDSISKGHKVTKKNINQEVANWTDAYIAANIENIGPDFLLKYFQTDSKDSLSIVENYLRVVSQIDSDSQVSEDSWDLTTMFANRADSELVSKYQQLVAKIVKYTKEKNTVELKETCVQLRKQLEKLVKDNGSRQYSNAAIVMAINESFAGANVAKVNGYANVVIPSDLRKVVYTDGALKCVEATRRGKGTFKENSITYGGQDNVYMKAVLGLFEEIEKDMEQVRANYATLTEEQKTSMTSEISYNATLNTVSERLLSENVLDTFVKNEKYKKLYYSEVKLTSNNVKPNKQTKVVKSNSAKKINKKKKNNKKVTIKDIGKKDFIKGTVTGIDGKKIVTTKSEQLLIEANNQGYSAGYSNGMSKGSQGKDKTVGHIEVPSRFSSNNDAKQAYVNNYKSGFSKGYTEGYAVYKEAKDYKKVVQEETKTTVTESEVKDIETLNNPTPKPSSSNVEVDVTDKATTNSEAKIDDSEVYDVEELTVSKNSTKISALKDIKKYIQSLPEVEDVGEFIKSESVNIK